MLMMSFRAIGDKPNQSERTNRSHDPFVKKILPLKSYAVRKWRENNAGATGAPLALKGQLKHRMEQVVALNAV